MISREDLESFLIRMDLDWDELEEGMFLVGGQSQGAPLVVHHSPPLLILRMKVMELPDNGQDHTELYRTLLEFNASDVVHGAYGIEEGELILSDTLQLETLDFEELQASSESLQIAASTHIDRIRVLAGASVAADSGEEG